MKWLNAAIFGFLILLFVSSQPGATQDNVCSRIVERALQATDRLCDNTRLNQACYGHAHLEAQFNTDVESSAFDRAGEKIDIATLASLRLSALNTLNGDWGVALMEVQARLPQPAPVKRVTFLMFGDVEVRNGVEDTTPTPLTAARSVFVRRQPDTAAPIFAVIAPDDSVNALGRTADSRWIYIVLESSGEKGWIAANTITSRSAIARLRVLNPETAHFGPMQAFYLRSGQGEVPECEEMPESGMLIQTPDGVAEVSLWINEVKVSLGSTAFIQARPDNQMSITMLEGHARVEAFGVEVNATAGEQLTVPIDENLKAAAPPSEPVAVDPFNQNLPVENLERSVVPTPTATRTRTSAPTRTRTSTPTATMTATTTPTRTPTTTATTTPSATATATLTQTATVTPTRTNTPTATNTYTMMPTFTHTATATLTAVPTDPPTEPPTSAPTETGTPTYTLTATQTATITATPTATLPPTDRPTPTATQTSVDTPTVTFVPTSTSTGTPTLDPVKPTATPMIEPGTPTETATPQPEPPTPTGTSNLEMPTITSTPTGSNGEPDATQTSTPAASTPEGTYESTEAVTPIPSPFTERR